MLYYEQNVALPRMRHWLFESCRETPVPPEEVAWGDGHDLEFILYRFRTVRAGQIALLAQYDAADWDDERYFSGWGSVTLRWLVSKTYQHTAEHTHAVLGLALFWDRTPVPQRS
jgi:hypothetical protein